MYFFCENLPAGKSWSFQICGQEKHWSTLWSSLCSNLFFPLKSFEWNSFSNNAGLCLHCGDGKRSGSFVELSRFRNELVRIKRVTLYKSHAETFTTETLHFLSHNLTLVSFFQDPIKRNINGFCRQITRLARNGTFPILGVKNRGKHRFVKIAQTHKMGQNCNPVWTTWERDILWTACKSHGLSNFKKQWNKENSCKEIFKSSWRLGLGGGEFSH